MGFTDKTLRCTECGADFVWTGGEQAFFAEKRLEHAPRRCRACKGRRRSGRAPGNGERAERVAIEAVCSSCGRVTTLPFRPESGRPVFCRGCYQQRRVRSQGQGPA